MATMSKVWAAYERGRGRWSGCDWPARFGTLDLDMQGVSSAQALAVARRWRAIAAGGGITPQENDSLDRMALCLRRSGPGPEDPASIPSRCRCAKALAGEWEFAACLLAEIESDARQAQRMAWAAVRAAHLGNWRGALRLARLASTLESGYLAPRHWAGLLLAIESAAEADQRGGPLSDPDGSINLTTQREPGGDEQLQRNIFEARIAQAVLRALGKPGDLRTVQVRRLWDNCYRVNILTGDLLATAAIAHSYFLTADNDGEVLQASPMIERRY